MRSANLYLIAYGATLVVLYIASLFIPFDEVLPFADCAKDQDGVASAVLCLKDSGGAAIVLIRDMMKIVSSLDLAVFGAGAALVVKGREWSDHWAPLDAGLVILVFVCAAASLYGVYLSHVALLSLVALGVLDPFETRLEWSLAISYYGLLIAVILLGAIFLRMLNVRRPRE